ncbi:hypothetical protein [Pseudomonas sp.]|uniref:hypothetical protein n=1 Tax=Pseudomonas sp. TaxID=306 RepID=UPI002914851F|nr:hypothetical protein [Pseudomonas sp.]MDU4254404.1 hypothetical protein [Pseudomonas sp.]
MGPEDEIYEWLWDGKSIDGIKEFASERKLSLIDLVESYFPGGWQETVPNDLQGLIKGAVDERRSQGQYGAKGYQHLMQILAIDAQGEALVQAGVICIDTGAEGYELVETTKDGAIEMVEQYRAALALAGANRPGKPIKMG